MSTPFFSVLLPVYNAESFIARALRDLLAQTFHDFEIIVVDDGSSDGTAEVVSCIPDQRIRLISLPSNRGLVSALNAGLAEARGAWIARQDADDRCRRDRLERQRSLILQNSTGVLFYSRAMLIDHRGWWRGSMRPPLRDQGLRWDLCFRNTIPHTSVVFSTDLVREELDGYSGDNVTADFDLWSRLLRRGEGMGDGHSLVSYRIHSSSIMGRENAGAEMKSNAGVAAIMRQNLRELSEASEQEAAIISLGWLDPAMANWEQYFSARERLSSCHLHPAESLIAEEDYSLMHLAATVSPDCASALLRAMRSVAPKRYAAMPKPRFLMTRILKGF